MLISGNVHLLLSGGARMIQAKTRVTAPDFMPRRRGVLNKGAGAPYPCTAVCEGVRGEVTHEGVPTASECITSTVYDPGDDSPTEHTVYTVVCNVNTSLFDSAFFQAIYWVIPSRHGKSCFLMHVYQLRHVCVVGALPRHLC
jgi:hypothetical protein